MLTRDYTTATAAPPLVRLLEPPCRRRSFEMPSKGRRMVRRQTALARYGSSDCVCRPHWRFTESDRTDESR